MRGIQDTVGDGDVPGPLAGKHGESYPPLTAPLPCPEGRLSACFPRPESYGRSNIGGEHLSPPCLSCR